MRIHRLLSIILILLNNGKVTAKALADHFEVSLRTIYRDIDKIGEAGVPIAAKGGKGGGYYLMEDYTLNKFLVNSGEFQALMSVMDSLKVVFGNNQQFNDIVLKFQNTQSEKLNTYTINMSHFSMKDELKEYLFLMNKAIEQSRLLNFDYVNRNMQDSKRIAEPIRIKFSSGQWFLTAYCRDREDYRRFKLVRIRNLCLGDNFAPRHISDKELDEIFKKSYQDKSIEVVLKFTDRIGNQLTEYFLKETISKGENGGYIVRERFPYDSGLIKFILNFGDDCQVIEPDYLRDEVKNYMKNMLKKYNH